MTIYAGHQLSLQISTTSGPYSFAVLKGLRDCRWQIAHDMREADAIRADNWARFSDVSQRQWQLTCEVYGASHTAQTRVRTAALQGTAVRAKLTLASGEVLEGNVQIERYEEVARDDDMLEVAFTLVSNGSVTIT